MLCAQWPHLVTSFYLVLCYFLPGTGTTRTFRPPLRFFTLVSFTWLAWHVPPPPLLVNPVPSVIHLFQPSWPRQPWVIINLSSSKLVACDVLDLFFNIVFSWSRTWGEATGHYRVFIYRFCSSVGQQMHLCVAQYRNEETSVSGKDRREVRIQRPGLVLISSFA